MPGRPLVVAKLVGYLSGEVATYVATRGFTTKPTDTPADQHYKPLLTRIASIRRDCWDILTTSGRSRVGYGNAELRNVAPNKDAAGILDYLAEYAFDGRTFEQWYGLEGTAFPSAFTQITKATMVSMRLTRQKATIALRDRQAELNVPLQPNKYAGDNSLPGGLEGGPELKDKPKPWCFGTVFNVSAVCVNTSKNIFQVHDGAVASIDDVRDGGVSLNPGVSAWDLKSTGFGSYHISAGAYSDSSARWVIVGDAGTIAYSDDDGDTWHLVGGTPLGAHDLLGLRYLNGKFWCGIDVATTSNVASSSDGVTWTIHATATAGQGAAVGYSSLLSSFVLAGRDPTGATGWIQLSTDGGSTWTDVTPGGFGTAVPTSVMFDRGMWVVTDGRRSPANEFVATSATGYAGTWTVGTLNYSTTSLRAVDKGVSAGGYFIVPSLEDTATENPLLFVSTNGTTWTPRRLPLPLSSSGAFALAYGGGILVAPEGHGASPKIGVSTDLGISWTMFESGFAGSNINHAAYGNGRFIVVGNSGHLAVSSLQPATFYASQSDLLDEAQAPAFGRVGYYLAGGLFRTGSTPAGQLTADVTQGANAAARTGAQMFATVMVQAGLGSEYSTADVTTLDSKNSSVLGFWQGTEETNCNMVLDALCDTLGAWWAPDRLGVFRIKRLEDPRTKSPSYTLYAYDFVKPLELRQSNDQNDGIPPWKFILGYSRNYTVQDSGLFGVVDTADRLLYGQEWQTTSAEDASIVLRHLLSQPRTINTLFTTKADADTEATRRLALHGTDRLSFEGGIRMDATRLGIDLGDIVEVIHPRFGLSAGLSLSVMMQEPVHAVGEQKYINIGVWG